MDSQPFLHMAPPAIDFRSDVPQIGVTDRRLFIPGTGRQPQPLQDRPHAIRVVDLTSPTAAFDPTEIYSTGNQIAESFCVLSRRGWVAVGLWSEDLLIFEELTGQEICRIPDGKPGIGDAIVSVAADLQERMIATVGKYAREIRLLSLDDFTVIRTFKDDFLQSVIQLAFSPDGKVLHVVQENGGIYWFDVETGAVIAHSQVPAYQRKALMRGVPYLVFSNPEFQDAEPNAADDPFQRMLSGRQERPFFWSVADLVGRRMVGGKFQHPARVTRLSPLGDTNVVVTGDDGGNLMCWNTDTQEVIARWNVPGPVRGISTSPTAKTIAVWVGWPEHHGYGELFAWRSDDLLKSS